jgi:hypothetical protein
MSPFFKARDMIKKHGEIARVQTLQVIALVPYNDYDKKTYWDLVLKELDHATSHNIQR